MITLVDVAVASGGPMKGATMLVTLERLDVLPSFSRPGVSNDNPYSEALSRFRKIDAPELCAAVYAVVRFADGIAITSTTPEQATA